MISALQVSKCNPTALAARISCFLDDAKCAVETDCAIGHMFCIHVDRHQAACDTRWRCRNARHLQTGKKEQHKLVLCMAGKKECSSLLLDT